MFIVEMQTSRDTQPREMLVTVEPSQDAEAAGRSRRKTRKKSKDRKTSGDAASADVAGEKMQGDGENDDADDGEFEVKRYPAYHYDMYGTTFSLTDGVRPSTLERDTDSHVVQAVTAEASERPAAGDEVISSVPQSSAVTAEQSKPKPPVKPLKPLPRTRKPAAEHATVSNKDTAVQPAASSAGADTALIAELSTLLKQRKQ